MNAQEEILRLIAAEDKTLAELHRKQRYHAERSATFKKALSVMEADKTMGEIRETIASVLEQERKDAESVGIKLEASADKKSALEEVISVFKVPHHGSAKNMLRSPPPRRPDWDYSHKDLREGTDIYNVRELLRKTGKPMPLADIVSELFDAAAAADVKQGKYASLRGTLGGYAKENRVFTMESDSPRVIGLIEFKK